MTLFDWVQFKSIVDSKALSIQWVDHPSHYHLEIFDGPQRVEFDLIKKAGSDLTDFETNYKNNGNSLLSLIHKIHEETFTIPTDGLIIDVSKNPLKSFSFAVTSTGIVTSWSVILEGGLNGIKFAPIAVHTEVIGNGETIFPGSNLTPSLYFRIRCEQLVLGSGTNVIAKALGFQ